MHLIYSGLLSLHNSGDATNILFLSSIKQPLAEQLRADISNETVTARYWITDRRCSMEDAIKQQVLELVGATDVEFESHYSEYTGYLWTDEEIEIGGHDLLAELKSNVGKWLILEVTVHE